MKQKRKKILVVEPNTLHYQLYKNNLHTPDYGLNRVSNLQEAACHTEKSRYDALITENSNHEESRRYFSKIKSKQPRMPIIVMSSDNNEEHVIHTIKMGADDYIVKNRKKLAGLKALLDQAIKRANQKNAPISSKSSPFHAMIQNIRNLTDMINEGSKQQLLKGKIQFKGIERELDHLKGLIKNFIN